MESTPTPAICTAHKTACLPTWLLISYFPSTYQSTITTPITTGDENNSLGKNRSSRPTSSLELGFIIDKPCNNYEAEVMVSRRCHTPLWQDNRTASTCLANAETPFVSFSTSLMQQDTDQSSNMLDSIWYFESSWKCRKENTPSSFRLPVLSWYLSVCSGSGPPNPSRSCTPARCLENSTRLVRRRPDRISGSSLYDGPGTNRGGYFLCALKA